MLTISVLPEEQASSTSLDKTQTTVEQKEADDYIKLKINQILNREAAEQAEINELPGTQSAFSQRRMRRNLWKNISTYVTSGGLLFVHIAAIWLFRFASYKFISNKEIMSSSYGKK